MNFRCVECLSESWLDGRRAVQDADRLECSECGREYLARPSPDLGASVAAQYAAIVRASQDRALDVATSFSLLLGILSEGDLELLGAVHDDVEDRSVASVLVEFDPAFAPAVQRGNLSVQEAVRRGDREAYVDNLVTRHGLSRRLANEVADNRITLHRARESKKGYQRPRVTDLSPAGWVTRSQSRIAAVLGVCVLALAVWHGWQRNLTAQRHLPAASESAAVDPAPDPESEATPATQPRQARRLSTTEIERNDMGQVVRIRASDAATVLLAFCRSETYRSLEPVEITETVPALNHARLGLFRDPDALESLHAIWMRHDRRSGRWIAGDGKGQIPTRTAPDLPPQAVRIPVEDDS